MGVVWQPEFDDEGRKWLGVAKELSETHFASLADELDREQRYPQENVDKLVESGLLGRAVATEAAA